MPALADLFRERYLGADVDFAAVRLHHGNAAGQACRELRARAFTVGTDIYFADGAFQPGTRDGLRLLAHEVAHVVQQAAGLAARPREPAGRPGRARSPCCRRGRRRSTRPTRPPPRC